MKKILTAKRAPIALALALLLACLLPLAVSAAEGESEGSAPVTAVTTVPADPTVPTVPTDLADPAESTEGDYTPIGTLLHEFLAENLSGLLSGATFLLALVLSLLLRKRVLPPLLETLTALLGKSRDLSEALSARETEGHERLTGLFTEAERILCEARVAAERAEEAADAIREGKEGRAEAALILREQTSLLYELLMSANLPQYQKDRIGEAHAAALAALREIGNG